MRNVTMKDVAAYAGVSVATVSHVINESRFVSDETKTRVENAIKQLGFTPNAAARSFKSGKKNTVGFIIPDISNPYFSSIVEAFEDTISCYGYSLILTNTRESREREIEHIRNLCSGMVDGLAIASTVEEYAKIEPYLRGIPTVFVDRTWDNVTKDTVTLENEALYTGICDLLRSGHRNIGYIAGLERLNTTKERVSIYKKALKEFSVEIDESYITYANSMSKSAIECVNRLLGKGCTSFVVSNNVMAFDTLSYLQKSALSLSTPIQPINVLGYSTDNWPAISSILISSVVPPARDIGKVAGDTLIERINHPERPIQQIKLGCRFIK